MIHLKNVEARQIGAAGIRVEAGSKDYHLADAVRDRNRQGVFGEA